MQLGKTIRKYRNAKNLTQEEVARRLGVTALIVDGWEQDVCMPDIALLVSLAELFEVSLDTLLGLQPELTEQEAEQRYEKLLANGLWSVSQALKGLSRLAIEEGNAEKARFFLEKQNELARLFELEAGQEEPKL